METSIWPHCKTKRKRSCWSCQNIKFNNLAKVYGQQNCDIRNFNSLLGIIENFQSLTELNKRMEQLTGISDFFIDIDEYKYISNYLLQENTELTLSVTKDFGDYQTPLSLTDKICKYLYDSGVNPQLIIEPTFGSGHFIISSLSYFKNIQYIHGIEIQKIYVTMFKILLLEEFLKGLDFECTKINVQLDNIFTHVFPDFINKKSSHDLLVIGNPPWITNSELSILNSKNLPLKSNLKKHSGLDAITGKSNFDIAEYIILKMIEYFSDNNGTIAFICKNIVIRNILNLLPEKQYKLYDIKALQIDTKKEFGVNCDASVFIAKMGKKPKYYSCEVADLNSPNEVKSKYGWIEGKFVSNVDTYISLENIDGTCQFTWRQGLKHDASKVMELTIKGNQLQNSLGEVVDIESDLIYPLIKSSHIKNFKTNIIKKMVIVPQSKVGEDTSYIHEKYPLTWMYLYSHNYYFLKRKSKIYKNKPPFSIFGVGDYAFKPYKVIISGMYKDPLFSLVSLINGKPVMLDDTCYFLSFEDYKTSVFVCTLLNSDPAQRFIKSISFVDSKRVYTKSLLMRINLKSVSKMICFNDMKNIWDKMDFVPSEKITEKDYQTFQKNIF